MGEVKRSKKNIDLTIVVTARAEGILLHKTLLSINRSRERLKHPFSSEVILHIDNPTPGTRAYVDSNQDFLQGVLILENSFSDAGASRNFAVEQAHGRFVTFIDGDDLACGSWFQDGLAYLQAHEDEDVIAHNQYIVEFGDFSAIGKRYDNLNRSTETLLSVYANRWNAIIMTKRSLLLKYPYTVSGPGFGYEDWQLMNRLIFAGCRNVAIPGTVSFIRRKTANSRGGEHRMNRAVLPANDLLSFQNIRKLDLADIDKNALSSVMKSHSPLRLKARDFLAARPGLRRVVVKAYDSAKKVSRPKSALAVPIPTWLIREWQSIHDIDRSVFPANEKALLRIQYDTITSAHWKAGLAYKAIVDRLRYDHYDYILFAPWLNAGGADKFTIGFINTVQALEPTKRVLVVATVDTASTWDVKLAPTVDFLPFGQITHAMEEPLIDRVLEQLIENSGAAYLHIVNSERAYNFVYAHQAYMADSHKRLILTAFSQSVDSRTGRTFGYSHTHIPDIYNLAVVSSDNQALLNMWHQEYGFATNKLFLIRQPAEIKDKRPYFNTSTEHKPLRILWAGRLSPEKMPELVPKIARQLQGNDITIDMYGNIDDGFDTRFLKDLPSNAHYRGGYNGFASLPIKDYDVFLYTSLFDGMPNILLEVASQGLPIVSSAVGGIPELIENERTGLLVTDIHSPESYARLLERMKDSKLRQELASSLLTKINKEFTEASHRKQVLRMLVEVGFIKAKR